MTRALLAAAAAALLLLVAPDARAADARYPERPVTLLVPVQPGGGVDLVARTIAEQLERALGQRFVAENVSGGGGAIAAQRVAAAAPDGYTLLLAYVATHGTLPALRPVPYDPLADFTPIARIAGTPNVLVVPSALPERDLAALLARARRERLSYASAGAGTLTHLAMEQLRAAAGFEAVHVPYRGAGPALADAIRAALDAPALRERLAGEALEPMPLGPAEFGRFVAEELSRWSALVRERGLEIGE